MNGNALREEIRQTVNHSRSFSLFSVSGKEEKRRQKMIPVCIGRQQNHDEGDEGKKDGDQREGRSGKRQQQDECGGRERRKKVAFEL